VKKIALTPFWPKGKLHMNDMGGQTFEKENKMDIVVVKFKGTTLKYLAVCE
jgi:hypothetical protein